MPVTCQMIVEKIEKTAPLELMMDWDNSGLLAGSPADVINKIVVSLDATMAAAERACSAGNTLLVTHHPLIFKPLKSLRADCAEGKLLTAIIKKNVAVYSSHTSFDIAPGGINDILAAKLGLSNTMPLEVTKREKLYKLIVFVPETHLEEVRLAMTNAGAGHIGNYSGCTFAAAGTGTFLPLAGANPFIGEEGKLEYVKEHRLETIMPEFLKAKVIAAMLAAHPYEEVAYDEILLGNSGQIYGLGRVGDLEEPILLDDFIQLVKSVLGLGYLKAARAGKNVRRVAVCGGSGAGLVPLAAALGADVFVTGDVKYHEAQTAVDWGLTVLDAGHFGTESIFVSRMVEYLEKCAEENGWDVKIEGMALERDIFSIY